MSRDIYITAKREVEIYESNVTYNLADMYYKCIDKEKGFKKLDGMNCKEGTQEFPMCPKCNEPTYGEDNCPFCGEELEYE